MGNEAPRIVGTESEEEKKAKANIANATVSKAITKDLLYDFLRSEEFKLKNDVGGEFGFLPVSNDKDVCNLVYFPEGNGKYKSIIISLITPPESKDKDQKPVGKTLHVETAGEDEGSLTMMICALAESLRKFNPNSMEVKLQPKDANAKKIMEEACKKYGLKVVESFSSEKKASEPGATLKMDKPSADVSQPRVVGRSR